LVSTAENLMPGDAPEAGELIRRRFEHEELRIHLGFKAVRAGGGRLTVQGPAGARELPYDALLLGAGRKANIEQLGLEVADVRFGSDGVEVDDYLRTSNPNIYAAGDVAFPQKFTRGHCNSAAACRQRARRSQSPGKRACRSPLYLHRPRSGPGGSDGLRENEAAAAAGADLVALRIVDG